MQTNRFTGMTCEGQFCIRASPRAEDDGSWRACLSEDPCPGLSGPQESIYLRGRDCDTITVECGPDGVLSSSDTNDAGWLNELAGIVEMQILYTKEAHLGFQPTKKLFNIQPVYGGRLTGGIEPKRKLRR